MIDELKLKMMRKKPDFDEIVRSKDNPDVDLIMRVAFRRAGKEQNRLLKKAAKIKE